jgi:hypothetical protein
MLLLNGPAGVVADRVVAGLTVGGRKPQSKTRLVVVRLANGARTEESASAQLRRKLPTGTPRRARERRSETTAAKGGTQRRVGEAEADTVTAVKSMNAVVVVAAVDCSSSAREIQISGIIKENMYSLVKLV